MRSQTASHRVANLRCPPSAYRLTQPPSTSRIVPTLLIVVVFIVSILSFPVPSIGTNANDSARVGNTQLRRVAHTIQAHHHTTQPTITRPCSRHSRRIQADTTARHDHSHARRARNHKHRRDSARTYINAPALHTTRQKSNHNPPWGSPPRPAKRGRWPSSADAECAPQQIRISRYTRFLYIFSWCNRYCTLHVVYNGLWIDVDVVERSCTASRSFQPVPVECGLYGFALKSVFA